MTETSVCVCVGNAGETYGELSHVSLLHFSFALSHLFLRSETWKWAILSAFFSTTWSAHNAFYFVPLFSAKADTNVIWASLAQFYPYGPDMNGSEPTKHMM